MILGVEGRCIYIPAATVVFIFLTSTILVSNLEKTALTPRTWPSTGRSASTTLEFRYRLRVDFPIKARTPSSQV